MAVAVVSLGCDRKSDEGFPSWPVLFDLQGDYSLCLNYETSTDTSSSLAKAQTVVSGLLASHPALRVSFDVWQWHTSFGHSWRRFPQFDQDQARLASIVCARSMGIEYALQMGASHLLFVDADIIPPLDIIPKLLEVNRDAVCGLVYGRGVHKDCPYIFGEMRRWTENGYELVEVEHANIGFTMLSRRLFEAVRFRYGTSQYPDGRECMTSDDPAFHLDCFLKFGQWPVVRTDVVGQHVGDLSATETSQF